jgi:hypothetical protein
MWDRTRVLWSRSRQLLIDHLSYLIAMKYPDYLYKYRKDDRHSLNALFEGKAIFSSRKAFNDPFDSHFKLVDPTIREWELIDLSNRVCLGPHPPRAPRFLKDKKVTTEGARFLSDFKRFIADRVDSYRFLCLSANPTSAPMWAHYSDNHEGFCIEFKSKFVKADKVLYREPQFDIKLASFLISQGDIQLSIDLWQALRAKHTDWSYEQEYRFQPSKWMQKEMLKISAHNDSAKYESEWVEAIIFGKNMPIERRRYIIENHPRPMKFKQVVIENNCLSVADYL